MLGLIEKSMRCCTCVNVQSDRAAIGLTKDAVQSQSLAGQYWGGIDNTMRNPIFSCLSSWILAKLLIKLFYGHVERVHESFFPIGLLRIFGLKVPQVRCERAFFGQATPLYFLSHGKN